MIALTPQLIGYLIVGFWALLFIVFGYLAFKRWLRPRIKCTFIYADRRQRTAYIKPNEQGLLAYKDGLYIYSSELIIFSGAVFGMDTVPSLVYHYDHPSPVDMWGLKASKGVTSQMLSGAWNDKSLRDFVRAQESPGIRSGPLKIGGLVVIVGIFLGGYVVFGTDFLQGMSR